MAIRLTLMGGAALVRDGARVPLEGRIMAVLIRLVLEAGQFVPLSVLSEDGLQRQRREPAAAKVLPAERERDHVQKAIMELRRGLDPTRAGAQSKMIELERGPEPAYRLRIDPSEVDILWFEELITESRTAPSVRALQLLEEALALWQGRPLANVADREWAKPRIAHLESLRGWARHRLFALYAEFGLRAQAARLGSELLSESPYDHGLRQRLDSIGDTSRAHSTVARLFANPMTTVTVTMGDLFEQDDAHLVIGFMDTFETNAANDFLVSGRSLQGQLVARLFDGDHSRLDRALRRALKDIPGVVESRDTKKYGKLIRYPVGTVVPVRQGNRLIFCVAYSKAGPDGRHGRSSLPLLEHSLDQLWPAVRARGQFRPVALGLLGSGLARIEARPLDLVDALLRSFLRHRAVRRFADELRLVLRAGDESEDFLHSAGDLLYRL